MSAPRDAVLAISNLGKSYRGGPPVLHDVDLVVGRGEVVGLVGPNGAGKSTLLHIAAGVVRPTTGSVRHLTPEPAGRTSPPGCVFEAAGFHPGFTAAETLRQIAAATGHDARRADAILHEVGLAPRAGQAVGTLSLGMRQRLAIGAALVPAPSVLLLDEPANGLDPPGLRWLRDLVARCRRDGLALVIASHLLDELARTADRLVVIVSGEIVADDTPEALAASAGSLEDAVLHLLEGCDAG